MTVEALRAPVPYLWRPARRDTLRSGACRDPPPTRDRYRQNLPPVLVHAPAGLYVSGTRTTAPHESSGPPTGALIPLGLAHSGTTITVHVGDVLAPPPVFPGQDPSNANPARSSNHAVLGTLGSAE